MSKVKLLMILTVVEIITGIISVVIFIATFNYQFEVALSSITSPWIGGVVGLDERYDVVFMNALSIVSLVFLFIFWVANIVRFVNIKWRFRIELLICLLLVAAYIYLFTNLISNPFSAIFLLAALVLYIHSHKIRGEYDE